MMHHPTDIRIVSSSSSCRKKRTAGFSLVEVLVYIGVLILIATATVTTLLSLDDVLLRNSAERDVRAAASIALERMVRDIRDADLVDVPASTLGSSPGVLVLEEGGGATTTTFSLSGGQVTVERNGTVVGPLTSGDLEIEKLIFRRYSEIAPELETELVRIELAVSAKNKAASTTRTFYTSAIVRGSYE